MPESPTSYRSSRVLLVEDNLALATMLRGLLERRGWVVDHAGTVSHAIEFLRRVPEWLVLDLKLPDGAGEQVFEQVKREGGGTRVVVVTGSIDEARLRGVREMGPVALLHKPISLGELLAHMKD